MEMKPPVSATIPKSRNHRRTPPTPPAHSPSPPSINSPPRSLTTPVSALIDVLFAATATDKLPASHVMEINTSYGGPLVKPEKSSPPLGSPQLPPCSVSSELTEMANDAAIPDASFEQRLLQASRQQLKQHQQLQQQLLLHQYQQQQQQLTEQHQKQLQQHIKLQQNLLYHQFQQEHQRLLEQQENELHSHLKQYLEQQNTKREEEREKHRKETERLEALKNKEKSEQSANASSEVKQRLQEVILKKHRDAAPGAAAGGGGAGGGTSSLRTWPPGSDFPLRKTASEPNICLKARHKQRMGTERRPSPLVARRKDKLPCSLKRRPPYAVESGSTPDSGQSSPPNGLPTSRSSSGSTPIHEEGGGSPYGAHGGGGQGSCSDLPVYSSLPNISMGRPPHSTQPEGLKLPIVSEADMRTLPTHIGMPLTGHPLSSTLPYYPTLPVIDGEGYSMGGAARGQQVTAMETSSGGGIMRGGIYHPSAATAITDPQVRTSRSRPLSRTHSSPLPLGHPVLQGQPPSFLPHAPQTAPHQHTLDHHLLKQHIRQTVLTRANSKNQVENVAEETEAAVAQAIATDKTPEGGEEEALHEEEPEVIDLTERKIEESQLARHHREHLLFPHHRDLTGKPPPLHSSTISLLSSLGSAFTPRSGSHMARPLSRALSSPLVTLSPQGSPQEQINISKQGATTGFAYDNMMLKHQCACGDNSHHPEHAGRLHSIMARLQETGLFHRCYCLRTRKATPEEIQSCHSEAHTLLFGTNPLNRSRLDLSMFADLPIKSFVRLHCGGIGVDLDTTWNEMHTSSAARMAAGCVIDLSYKVATGELRNGFALVRPPGHHAEHQQAMGFCFFNSVAIAARQLHQKLSLEKILIVDWDVHHGNGTQSMFYNDPHILYISMHRYDDGSFFPGTGAPTDVGEGNGYGFNVNIAFSGGLKPPMGDAEYLAAFRSVVMPIAKDFDPDVVLVSAGFDAADGHPPPLGGYKVSASCFAHMTKQLMTLARGKVVLALEGGYDLTSISDASEACVRALTGEDPPPISEHELTRPPCQNALKTLQNVIAVQSGPWPVVRRQSALLGLSQAEAQGREDEQETVSAMASLRVDPQNSQSRSPEPSPQATAAGASNDEEEPMDEDSEVK
ncbi:histone deacetylase 4-like isoform X9 [Eriocheir sinensis]|uniref:histone deacetylase 4-like isoform X9 n=1 Tax=Eriocheir sinensis TaxID=95602 RepID=UPI0021C7CF7D|nr:histone deacetylase 4-like isoform X9 [Eriocheir sinensis]